MSVLSQVQRACLQMGLDQPVNLYGNSERTELELREVAEEAAEQIGKAHEWQLLKTLATISGDGTTTSFSLPDDFERFPKKQQLWSSKSQYPYSFIRGHDDWLQIQVRNYSVVWGAWTLLGGNIVVTPAPAATETISYYYQSENVCETANGVTKRALFTKDTDVLRLPERLLRLGVIWRWKAKKGRPYAEDMANYEFALSEEIERDKPQNILRIGTRRSFGIGDGPYPKDIVVS